MNKKITALIALTLAVAFGWSGVTQAESPAIANGASAPEKTLVVYYSRRGNTQKIAQHIHAAVGGDLVEIQTVQPYPDDYRATVEQARIERNAKYRPALRTKIDNIQAYTTIFVGFPIWGGDIPAPVRSFLTGYDLSGKTVVPFATHSGFGRGNSFSTVAKLVPDSTIPEGFALEGDQADSAAQEITNWLRKIGMVS